MTDTSNKTHKNIELAVNILLVIVFLSLISVLLINYFSIGDQVKKLEINDKISLPKIASNKQQKNLILFLDSNCYFCIKSVGFYREIAKEIKDTDKINLISVFTENKKQSKNYLEEMGLDEFESATISFADFGVSGTPTIILTDENGIVENIWIGYLSLKRQSDVRKKIGLKVPNWFIEEAEVKKLTNAQKTIKVVDVRLRKFYQRKHFQDAINIPLDELSVRAINELDRSQQVIVYGTTDNDNDKALEILSNEGFKQIHILNYSFPQ